MNNTNIVDKVYLALELTKIRYNIHDNASVTTDNEIIETYLSYIEKLTDIEIEKIATIPELEKQLESITNKYKMLQESFNTTIDNKFKKANKDALLFLDNAKIDMENYVYNKLKSILENK